MIRIIARRFSDNNLEELISKGLNKLKRDNRRLPNIQVLKLYREVLKFSNEFSWTDKEGIIWKEKIRKSARDEIELARDEQDPVMLAQMVITSREAINKLRDKLIEKYKKRNDNILNEQFIKKPSYYSEDFTFGSTKD